jgi:hypothetical protein
MNFAAHEHNFDPLTYRCRVCGMDEIEVFLEAHGYQTFVISEPFKKLPPITEALRDASRHWP